MDTFVSACPAAVRHSLGVTPSVSNSTRGISRNPFPLVTLNHTPQSFHLSHRPYRHDDAYRVTSAGVR